jgi:peptidoglycan hydrolase CwlO-like protein
VNVLARALAALLIGTLSIAGAASAANTTSQAAAARQSALDAKIKAQQAKLHVVRTKLNQKRTELDAAQAKVGTISDQLDVANRNIAAVESTIGTLKARMHTTEANLAWNHRQLDAAQRTLQRHNDALKRRLISAYEYGDLGYVAVLLQAKTFGDFVERWNDIGYVIRANEATIRQRRADADRIGAIQAGLVAAEASLQAAQADAQQQQNALDALAQQRRNLLSLAQNEKQNVAVQVGELEDTSAEAEAALEALVRQKQQEEDARRASERRAALLAGESLPPEPGAPGELMWRSPRRSACACTRSTAARSCTPASISPRTRERRSPPPPTAASSSRAIRAIAATWSRSTTTADSRRSTATCPRFLWASARTSSAVKRSVRSA